MTTQIPEYAPVVLHRIRDVCAVRSRDGRTEAEWFVYQDAQPSSPGRAQCQAPTRGETPHSQKSPRLRPKFPFQANRAAFPDFCPVQPEVVCAYDRYST